MANEYLKRTPTSTGNRKVFTFALWLKRNIVENDTGADAVFNAADTSANSHGTDIRFRKDNSGGNNYWNFFDYVSGSFNWVKYGDIERRDSGNWFHAMFVFDSTKPRGDDRVEVYINGVLDNTIDSSYDTNPSQNYETYVNSITEHYLGVDQYDGGLTTSYSKSQFSDVFLVDGQALTPDVFGFYKDGDGYMSSGTANATDFKPGQWMPHSPSKIKKDINRRGGFGVNGFYLPMNDSSNPGADFHCDSNSIITLKGEDLPQPRIGAPTTSDSYVSQLRSDPFAANLVLAVPGISTATGANLVSNGHFDTNTTGWTAGNSGTLSVDSGRLKVTNGTSSAGYAYQEITVVIGQRYTVNLEGITGTSASNIRIGTAANSASYGNKIGSGLANISLTATSTSLYVTLKPNSNTNGNNALFDNVVVKQEDAPRDYSADIKGSGTNKTPTLSGTSGIGYKLGGYYGSAMTFPGTYNHNIPLGANTDFAFGTGDFTVEMWFYTNQIARQRILSSTQGGFVSTTWVLRTEPTNILAFYSNNTINSSVVAAANQWHHVAVTREGLLTSLYLNGVCIGIDTNDNKNYTEAGSNNFWLSSGYTVDSATENLDGYIQDLRIYKGVAKYKGGFDVPKPYTPVGIEAFRTTTDTCKNNFATLNPVTLNNPGLTDGNLKTVAGSSWRGWVSTFSFTSGKYYMEMHFPDTTNSDSYFHGMGLKHDGFLSNSANEYFGDAVGKASALVKPGSIALYNNGNQGDLVTGTYTGSHIMGMAIDADSGKVWWSMDGTWIGANPSTGNSASYTFTAGQTVIPGVTSFNSSATGDLLTLNFGQNPSFSGTTTAGTNADDSGKGLFKYAPPSGFLALCEDNLPAPAIADPGEHFKCVLYTGDGKQGRSITGVGFKPDFVWIKERAGTSNHNLYDSVRGVTKRLYSDLVNPEYNYTNSNSLNSFDNDGFSIGSDGALNQDTIPTVAWCWKAGGAATANTDGSINSSVSANQTAGFSIVSYTGNETDNATVGHGLGKVPDVIIVKNRSGLVSWGVWHSSLTSGQVLRLDQTTQAQTPGTAYFQDENNTSSVFALGTNDETNDSDGDTYIAYCWTEIEGYSKFGSYVGNGNADGPFVYCGFKPAWIMIKQTNDSNNWHIADSSRKSVNPVNMVLRANLSDAESANNTSFDIDFLSNGFKLRSTNDELNQNNSTYIFMAFAESPFKTANAK